MEEENEAPIMMDINQLAFLQGQLFKGLPLKNALLKYISQIHCMVRALDVESYSKWDLEDSKKVILDQNRRIEEQKWTIQEIEESKLVLERKMVHKYEAWTKKKEYILQIKEGQRDKLIQNHKILDLEWKKLKC
uniref:Predicted protein n=1 Tax=Physcomitrium patens TaxID=3218 RepID=A9TME7_PHYPA